MTKTRKRIIAGMIILLVLLVVFTVTGNMMIELNAYRISNNKLPEAFDGYRIAHISDLHNAEFGDGNERLLKLLRQAKPDMIAITGDLIDSRHTNIPIALSFAEQAMQIAPCYYVSGNHEARINGYSDLKAGLEQCGVIVLENQQIKIEKSGAYISVIGVEDPSFQTDYLFGDASAVIRLALDEINMANAGFMILLSHRPELFDTYVAAGLDLVLTGHAHGGQIRVPVLGGLVAPNQGFFPKYDSGLYNKDGTEMVVSRGIGNSILPFRMNNPPEVILIELAAECK